jgi:hypothetical protein
MAEIIVNNNKGGIVNVYNIDYRVSQAKDKLLSLMYHARYKETMGGYEGWLKLLSLYDIKDYEKMYEFIESFSGKGKGGKTRNECLNCLEIIMNGGDE